MAGRPTLAWLTLVGCLFGGLSAHSAEVLTLAASGEGIAVVRARGVEAGIAPVPAAVGILTADGQYRRVVRVNGSLALGAPTSLSTPDPVRPEAILLDGEITRGTADITRAWLSAPTERYRHGVLGDAVEAGALVLERADGRRFRYVLDAGSVFEDRRVRLIDLDQDGRDEAIVVQSYLDEGAALAVFAMGRDGVTFISQVPAIGRANRWLNPVGAGDFDGDGVVEIAYVETPHIGGALRLFEYRDRRLHEDHAARGFSNHAIGSRVQDQSAIHDWTGDGVPDMAVPDARRRGLRFVTFARGTFHEFDQVSHDQAIVTAIHPALFDDSGQVFAVYGLADGTLVAVRPGNGN
jgi:hypothetical protein